MKMPRAMALVGAASVAAALMTGCESSDQLPPFAGPDRLLAFGYTDAGDVYVGLGSELRLYDRTVGAVVDHVRYQPPAPQSVLKGLTLSNDAEMLATTWETKAIGLNWWDFQVDVSRVSDGAPLASLPVPFHAGNASFSRRGDLIATAFGGPIEIAVISGGAQVATSQVLLDAVTFAPDSDLLYGRCSGADSLCALDTITGEVRFDRLGRLTQLSNYVVTRDGGYVVGVEDTGEYVPTGEFTLRIRRTSDGGEVGRIDPVERYATHRVAASAGAAHWAHQTTSNDDLSAPVSLRIGTGAGELLSTLEIPRPPPEGDLDAVDMGPLFAFSPDGTELAIAPYPTGQGTGIAVLDVASGQVKASRALWAN